MTEGTIRVTITPPIEVIAEVTSTKIIPEITNNNSVILEVIDNKIIPQITSGNNPNLIVNPPNVIKPEITNNSSVELLLGNFSNNQIADEVYVCGEDIPAFKVVYISLSGKAFIAGYNIPNSRGLVRGITTISALSGQSITVRPFGLLANQSWTWGTSGSLYLQTNGDIDIVPPDTIGDYIQKIAIIKSSMVILLSIDETTIGI